MVEIIPLWLVNLLSFITIFSVMTSIGTTLSLAEGVAQLRAPGRLLRGLFSVLVAVPAIGFAVGFALRLSLAEHVGIALMAIAPGAPLALRRSLGSGGHAAYAPVLQMTVAVLAVPALPVWVLIGNQLLGTHGFVVPGSVARQVMLAQVLPLLIGASLRHLAPTWSGTIGTLLGRAGAILLIGAIVSQMVDLHTLILSARPWPVAAAVIVTVMALICGHLLGGDTPDVRHAVALASALRNVGLALLVAAINQTPPTVQVVIVSYAIAAALVVTAYIALRNKFAPD